MEIFDISVLYVEDADIIRNAAAEMIRQKVKTLYLGKNGLEGLELFNEFNPDIVITDIGMPEMDGLEMSREIKRKSPETKIIITTAHDDSSFLLSSIEIGIDQYILKSSIKSQIILAINKWYDLIILEKRKRAESDFIFQMSKTILEQSQNLVMVTNPHGLIEYVNKQFLEVTGFSEEEIIGHSPDILKSGKHDESYFKAMYETLNRGEKWLGELINKKKTGELFRESAVIFPVRDSFGNTEYFVKSSVILSGSTNMANESIFPVGMIGVQTSMMNKEQIALILKPKCPDLKVFNITIE